MLPINLVQIAAHSKHQTARADRRQIILVQPVIALQQILNAIRLGEKFAAIECVNIDFLSSGLVAADEMAGQADADDGQAQSPGQQNIQHAEADGISGAAINHTVQVAVLGIVVIIFVAGKAEFAEKVTVDLRQNGLGLGAGSQTLPNGFG